MQSIKPWHKLALLGITAMVLLKFMLLPWQGWLQETTEQIRYYKNLHTKLEHTQQRAELLHQQHDIITADYTALMAKLLPTSSDNNIEVLRYLESKAKQYHLKINNRAVGELQPDALAALPVTITLQGHPEMVFAFLQEVESGSLKFVITSVSAIKPGLSVQVINLRIDAKVLLAPVNTEHGE